MANEIVVATLFMFPRWRLYQYVRLLLCVGCRWIPLVFASYVPFRLFQYIVKNNTKCRLGGNSYSWRYSLRPYGGAQCEHPVCFISVNRYHPTRTLPLTFTRTLWSAQCLDAVAFESSRLIRPTWMLCLERLR